MIDPTDKQTQALKFEEAKRGPGRPATGKAMSAAAKQKAYRERKAAQQSESGFDVAGLRSALEKQCERNAELHAALVKAEARILILEKQSRS